MIKAEREYAEATSTDRAKAKKNLNFWQRKRKGEVARLSTADETKRRGMKPPKKMRCDGVLTEDSTKWREELNQHMRNKYYDEAETCDIQLARAMSIKRTWDPSGEAETNTFRGSSGKSVVS